MRTGTYLQEILAEHRARAAGDARDLDDLTACATRHARPRPFAATLVGTNGLAVIAEIKRRSPSAGDMDPDLDPGAVAADYVAGGAVCLSVLTDEHFFAGSAADLAAAREAGDVPVLRKDFTVCEADVCDARIMGADAVLLIVAALSDAELAALIATANRLELAALVEVHDEDELARALGSGARLIGVNQRDLSSFAVEPERALSMARLIPEGVVAVAESGIRGPDDAKRLAEAGYEAILVGEHLVRAGDRKAAVSELVGFARGTRRDVGGS